MPPIRLLLGSYNCCSYVRVLYCNASRYNGARLALLLQNGCSHALASTLFYNVLRNAPLHSKVV
jgi:hypothetical protein